MLAKIESLLRQMAACKRCGAELPPGALTCPICPARVVANPWTVPAAPPGFGQGPAQGSPQYALRPGSESG
jgi:ribosomal protein L40E